MEIRGYGGITHFENSEGRGQLKYGSRPWYGMDIFWNCPLLRIISFFAMTRCLANGHGSEKT